MRAFHHFGCKLRIKQQRRLGDGQQDGQYLLVFDAQVDNQAHEHDVAHRHQVVDQFGLWIKCPGLRTVRDPSPDENDRREHQDARARIDHITPRFFIADNLK